MTHHREEFFLLARRLEMEGSAVSALYFLAWHGMAMYAFDGYRSACLAGQRSKDWPGSMNYCNGLSNPNDRELWIFPFATAPFTHSPSSARSVPFGGARSS
jgi:hypothetical protein